MSYPFFPVDMSAMQAHRHFDRVEQDGVNCRGVLVRTLPLNHPQGCLGYRLECGGHVLVYATDNEPGSPEHDRNVRKLAEGADVFIYDGQYTPLEYASQKKGWGHSTWREAVNIAQEAQVQQLVLFHHEPDHSDAFIDSILSETRKFFPNSIAAWEGLKIDLALEEHRRPQDHEERRHGTRQAARVPLKIHGQRTDGTPFEEQTVLEDLTLRGAYFLLANDPDPHTPLEIEFQAPPDALFGRQPFQVLQGQPVRNHAVKESGQMKRGIAVVFR